MIETTILKEILSQVGLDLTSLHKAKNTWFDKFGQNIVLLTQAQLFYKKNVIWSKCESHLYF